MFGGGSSIQDQMLKAYVDKIFNKYDTDKSGTLDRQELTVFFNQLFKLLGYNKQVTSTQTQQAIKTIDKNHDGSVSKDQLFVAFKAMLFKAQQQSQQTQQMNQQQQYYGGQQPMYPQQPYGGYGGYGYPPQGYPYGGYPQPQPNYGGGYYPQSPYYPPPMQSSQPNMYNPNQFNQQPYGNAGNFGNQNNPNPYISSSNTNNMAYSNTNAGFNKYQSNKF